MKPGKVLCCVFLLATLGLTLHKNCQNHTKVVYVCSYNYPIEALQLRNSCIVYENKTTDVQGQGPSSISLYLFVCFFDVYRASIPFC